MKKMALILDACLIRPLDPAARLGEIDGKPARQLLDPPAVARL